MIGYSRERGQVKKPYKYRNELTHGQNPEVRATEREKGQMSLMEVGDICLCIPRDITGT